MTAVAIAPPITTPDARVLTVDVATAKRWLDTDRALQKEWEDAGHSRRTNRRIRESDVARYAADMTAGRWVLTGAPVQFAINGRLLDGRHRLVAIIRSKASVRMFVVTGLPAESQAFMDLGVRRTLSDQLAIAGHKHHTTLAAAGRIALAWTTNRLLDQTATISDTEISDFIDRNPDLVRAAEFADTCTIPLSRPIIAAATWRLITTGHTPRHVHGFFKDLSNMCSDGPGDPKHALLNRLINARRLRERIKQRNALSLVIRVFNADYIGTHIVKISSAVTVVPDITPPTVVAD